MLVLVLSRFITSAVFLKVALFILGFIYTLSIFRTIYSVLRGGVKPEEFSVVKGVVALPVLYIITFALFIYKPLVFGVQLYLVPTNSMSPTLLPGDFILVDTWCYRNKIPIENDIIVFTLPDAEVAYVKRIRLWENQTLVNENNKYYVTGDNASMSRDSRYFGGVDIDNVHGKVTSVLFSIDEELNFRPARYLMSTK